MKNTVAVVGQSSITVTQAVRAVETVKQATVRVVRIDTTTTVVMNG